jgi:hypothetical protein
MRKYARLDANQKAVVTALRKIGCSVQSLASVGDGCPDLLVGWHARNFLMEVKDGSKPPSARRLTEDEADWFERWNGQAVTVESPEAAVNYMLMIALVGA